MESKTIFQSKNIWFNVLTIGAIVLTELQASTELKEALGANAFWLMIAGAVTNMLIRAYTVKPITISKPKAQMNPVDEALKREAEDNEMV